MIYCHNGRVYLECNTCGAVYDMPLALTRSVSHDSNDVANAAGTLRAKARTTGWAYADVQRNVTRDWCPACSQARNARTAE